MKKKKKNILVFGMGPVDNKKLKKLENESFDECYCCGSCISHTENLKIDKLILCLSEGRFSSNEFIEKMDKRINKYKKKVTAANNIDYSMVDECHIYINKVVHSSKSELIKCVEKKISLKKVRFNYYYKVVGDSIKVFGLIGYIKSLKLKGLINLIPSLVKNKQTKLLGYDGPSTGFKTIIKALAKNGHVKTIGIDIKSRKTTQTSQATYTYPENMINKHLNEDKHIYSLIKNKISMA